MFDAYDDLLTVEEAQEILKICRGNLYVLLQTGQLKGFRNGRSWRIPKEAIIQFIRTQSMLI